MGRNLLLKIRRNFLINKGIKNGKEIVRNDGNDFFNFKWEGIF